MLNKELLLASKRDYTLVYSLEDIPYKWGYSEGRFGQVLYDDVEANTSSDNRWKAFSNFYYNKENNTTYITLDYIGEGAPGSPSVFINGTQYQTDHGDLYIAGDPFDLSGLIDVGAPLYLDIKLY